MNYTVLKAEVDTDPLDRSYAGMTNTEVAASLNTVNRTQTYTRFCSYRMLADALTDAEYAAVKTFLAAAAQAGIDAGSSRVEDMIAMLDKPCGNDGSTGGLDFGCDGVRAVMDAFGASGGAATLVMANKVKALAEKAVSRATELGLSRIAPAHVQRTKEM